MHTVLSQEPSIRLMRERAETILWIKKQIAKYGVDLVDLQNAGCFPEPSVAAHATNGVVRFRDAQGHVWDGCGNLPDWLQRAVNAGQSIEHFRVGT